MSAKTRIDRAGRIVIPKNLRDRYGLEEGVEIEIIEVPDGITLVPARIERQFVRVGRVTAIATDTDQAPADVFDVGRIRSEQFVRKGGLLS
ncbi:MAG: AbrB/MazE/SpoVT family DNA-binding domain-containing protein [bacterium]